MIFRLVPFVTEGHSFAVPLEHVITGAALGAMGGENDLLHNSHSFRIYNYFMISVFGCPIQTRGKVARIKKSDFSRLNKITTFGSVLKNSRSKHGFRPIRARVIYMLFYNTLYLRLTSLRTRFNFVQFV